MFFFFLSINFYKGAIAPGYKADLILLDNLENIKITHVYKNGVKVVENGRLVMEWGHHKVNPLGKSVNFGEITANHLRIPLQSRKANIIEIIPNSLVTKHVVEKVTVDNQGDFEPSFMHDQLKLAVIERHHMTHHIGLGIVKGLGLKSGAIATTIAHDSHNLIMAGTNDHDMVVAAHGIKEMQGGLVVVENGEIISRLELSIGGLMSEHSYQAVYSSLKEIHLALKKLGASQEFNPFLTLSFLALPVIPELKLTDMGLFLVSKFEPLNIDSV